MTPLQNYREHPIGSSAIFYSNGFDALDIKSDDNDFVNLSDAATKQELT